MIKNESNEERLLSLFDRLRSMGLNKMPAIEESISPAQMMLLGIIATTPGCGVQDIADRLKLSPPTVSVGVGKMENYGLIERKPDPQDGRSVQFFLTKKGQTHHKKIRTARQQKLSRLLRGLNPQEQERFLTLFEQALNAAEEED